MLLKVDRETHEVVSAKIKNSKERITPIYVKDIGKKQPLTLLAKRILAWPCHDLRADSYVQNLEPDIASFRATDIELMKDLAEGIELKVAKKDITNNILEVTAEFQANLDEFERYNLAVEHHNDEWLKRGGKGKVFDPRTGDMRAIPDSYVDPAHIHSSQYPIPESSDENVSYGPLAKAKPSLNRKPVILIRYHLQTNKDDFTLSYVVYDKDHRVVYYNEVTHKDLSVLVRRSVQEIWGNPFIYGDSGSVLEGITTLMQGNKIFLCKKENKHPVILGADEEIKDGSTELRSKEVQQKALSVFEGFFRIWVPLITVIWFVWHSLKCFMDGWGDRHLNTSGSFLLGVFISGAVIALSFTLSYYMDRKISQIDAEKRFI